MRSYLIYIVIVIFAFSWVPSSLAEPNSKANGVEPQAHLALDSCVFDFGTVNADTIAHGVMKFKNTGDAPLQILTIFSECGCTSSSYTTDPVEPGECGEIIISFNGKKRKPGSFRKSLRIRSNADNPRVVLMVKGVVESME
ncbi:MAG: DUF1573 domain-containing protein [Muribaculaceae bacterium]|nr:DUF1573 domain-containing protein [Muribaculaceae bacterium]